MITTFAAIYIGLYEVSLKIYELSSKKVKAIDDVRKKFEVGKDYFDTSVIRYESVDELCDILNEFKEIIAGYKVKKTECYSSAVIREADNALFVLDQIHLRTGFEVHVISNSEHRFISYKAIAGKENFEDIIQDTAAIVDIGGASIQVTIFKKGKILTTQNLDVGTMKIRSLLYNPGRSEIVYQQQIEEYLNKRLEMFRSVFIDEQIKNIIFLNDYGTELISRVEKGNTDNIVVSADKMISFIDKLRGGKLEKITKELNLSNDKDPIIIPLIILFKTLIINLGSESVWIPGVNINDGIAYDYAQKEKIIKVTHDFDGDVISAAERLSLHYNSYSPHIKALLKNATHIFDAIKKAHGLGKRERLLLQVATILHDCGKYISLSNGAECSYNVIMSSEIIGLSHMEREVVALTVLYNSLPLDDYEELSDKIDKDNYLVVAKLSAILRVANALDRSHKQKFKNIKISMRGKELVILVETVDDITLEQTLFEGKTAYFENVFSMKPVLKIKRLYN